MLLWNASSAINFGYWELISLISYCVYWYCTIYNVHSESDKKVYRVRERKRNRKAVDQRPDMHVVLHKASEHRWKWMWMFASEARWWEVCERVLLKGKHQEGSDLVIIAPHNCSKIVGQLLMAILAGLCSSSSGRAVKGQRRSKKEHSLN